ncbi:hypothetical protein BJX99DRAFT_236459 [Aspergillus californicus]
MSVSSSETVIHMNLPSSYSGYKSRASLDDVPEWSLEDSPAMDQDIRMGFLSGHSRESVLPQPYEPPDGESHPEPRARRITCRIPEITIKQVVVTLFSVVGLLFFILLAISLVWSIKEMVKNF